jgi:hypothetical protein
MFYLGRVAHSLDAGVEVSRFTAPDFGFSSETFQTILEDFGREDSGGQDTRILTRRFGFRELHRAPVVCL